MFAFSGRRWQRWLDIMSSAVLKSLSDGTLVGGGARNFCTSGDNWGNLCMFIFHQETGIILAADERLRQELVQFCTYTVTISWHALKYCVEMIPETGSCLLLHRLFTTTHRGRRFQYCSLLLKYYHTPRLPQIRSKFWPEPDLAGFPKKGRMPDLPEPEPKSGTS